MWVQHVPGILVGESGIFHISKETNFLCKEANVPPNASGG